MARSSDLRQAVDVPTFAEDPDAFRVLVDAHRVEIHAHCYRILGSTHDAEDAFQDAMLRA